MRDSCVLPGLSPVWEQAGQRQSSVADVPKGSSEVFAVKMPECVFRKLSRFIQSHLGVRVPPSKKLMLEGRLRKRLRHLGFASFDQYCEFLFSPEGMRDELPHMVDVVTTHKTDFFREPSHFRYLIEQAVPRLVSQGLLAPGKRFLAWSAGCSTGQEPYTLAIVLDQLSIKKKGFCYAILATDVSERVIETGRRGIYEEEAIDPVPDYLRKRYFMRSRDRSRGLVRVIPELRSRVLFHPMNFLEDHIKVKEPFHVIFCRNVIIYFDKHTQQMIINKLCRYLVSNGYMFMGHSETIHGMNVPLVPVAPTVYRKIA